jgi:Ohr subfamily peroxiredoxin
MSLDPLVFCVLGLMLLGGLLPFLWMLLPAELVRPHRPSPGPRERLTMIATTSKPHEDQDNMKKILYTAEAVVEGGREGRGRTTDLRLAVNLSVPKEMGGRGGHGTNPEQLFALGYAACFQSTLLSLAEGRKLDASGSRITSRVGHGRTGLTVALDLHAPNLSFADAKDLMARAHERCPYSNATRRNVDVTLSVDGTELERTAA